MGGFFRNGLDFILRPTHGRTKGVIILFILIASVVLTVIVVQQQQRLRQRAASPPDQQSIQCQQQTTIQCGAEDGSCIFAGNSCEDVINYSMCYHSFTREQAEAYVEDNEFLCIP